MNAQRGTSLDEYRFLTKGYTYQKEMGLDINKQGYTFKQLLTTADDIGFIGMYLNGQSAPQAILAMINRSSVKPIYIGIPNMLASVDVVKLYETDKSRLLNNNTLRQRFENGMRQLLFQTLGRQQQSADMSLATRSDTYDYSKGPELSDKGIRVKPAYTGRITEQKSIPSSYDNTGTAANYNQPVDRSRDIDLPANNTSKVVNKHVSASVGGDLKDRQLIAPIQVYQPHQQRGIIVIRICANDAGQVTSAKYTQKGSTTLSAGLKKIALENARQVQFTPDQSMTRCGFISYHFK